MISINKKQGLPWSVRFYGLAKLFIYLLIITFLFSFSGHGTEMFIFFGRFMILVAIWLLIKYSCINYIVSEKLITINSGILIKNSKSIPFDSVQNINNSKGLLAMIFGVSKINIWTASPAQIQINNGNSYSNPSASLFLNHNDAEWLRDYILKNK